MISNYVPGRHEIVDEYHLVFDDGKDCGLWFPCDKDGKLPDTMSEEAVKNYRYALAHPENYVRAGEVICMKRRYYVYPHGTCRCGEEIELYGSYYGACECPHCGQWYNLFGQELKDPDQWDEEM